MKREDGVTLVELLVTMAILGTVASAIVAAVIVGLRTTDVTEQRLSTSRNAQLVSAYFAGDVAASETVSLSDSTCGNVAPVVRFRWDDTDPLGATVTKISSYVTAVGPSGERVLRRLSCENGTVVRDAVVAFGIATPGVVVTCTPACTPTGNNQPAMVTVDVTAGDFTFQASGARRVS